VTGDLTQAPIDGGDPVAIDVHGRSPALMASRAASAACAVVSIAQRRSSHANV